MRTPNLPLLLLLLPFVLAGLSGPKTSSGPHFLESLSTKNENNSNGQLQPPIFSEALRDIVNEAIISVDRKFGEGEVTKPDKLPVNISTVLLDIPEYPKLTLIIEEAARIAVQKYKLSQEQATFGLPLLDVSSTSLADECKTQQSKLPCIPGKYRSYNGHCNNVLYPYWGSSLSPYRRYLASDYSDNVALPKKSKLKGELPSASEVLRSVGLLQEQVHRKLTTLTVFFAQFVFHDIARTVHGNHKLEKSPCCPPQNGSADDDCMPIREETPKNMLKPDTSRCIEYYRSLGGLRSDCTIGPREQINEVTSYLDGSTIYGSTRWASKRLRSDEFGLLESTLEIVGNKRRELLPPATAFQCRSSGKNKCFDSGDSRVNENLGIALMHTLWMREHNRVARSLFTVNPFMQDTEIFEETRRIVAAQIQHITYNELLPSIIGQSMMDKYGLRLKPSGFYTEYDPQMNAAVKNAVAIGVLPVIYTMIPGLLERYSKQQQLMGSKKMEDTIMDPSDLYNSTMFDEYLMGLIKQKVTGSQPSRLQSIVADDASNAYGIKSELMAKVVQRGRDHGIPGYVHWRKFCDLSNPTKFTDLQGDINNVSVTKLSKAYSHVEDIDLFVGGLSEEPLPGAIVGPTFACLLGRQFHALRAGDRFWYENDLPPSSFNEDQLREIRKTSLARIVCNGGDNMDFVQPMSMVASDPYLNANQLCKNFQRIDIRKWKVAPPSVIISEKSFRQKLDEAFEEAKKKLATLDEVKLAAYNSRRSMASYKSSIGAHMGFSKSNEHARALSNTSLLLELVTENLVRTYLGPNRDLESNLEYPILRIENILEALSSVDLGNELSKHLDTKMDHKREKCYEHNYPCDHTSQFRSYSGWCNNLKNPGYGASLAIFNRLLPPAYDDKISSMRQKSVTGSELPTPRSISTGVHKDISAPHVRYALVTMQWGQFLDHDLTHTPMYMGAHDSLVNCTRCDSETTVHHECRPIPVPDGDPFFPSKDSATGQRRCMNFIRSLNGQQRLGPREQINQITAYIDASNVYGSTVCDAMALRSFKGGRLNQTDHPIPGHRPLLPLTASNPECRSPRGVCFDAGDKRASEQPALTSIHTIFMREHNRLVDKLSKVNPKWNDEQLYQNARKIVGAVAQRITYGEFLPRIFGLDYYKKLGLDLLADGYSDVYDPTCSATIFNEFAAACFRLGHSLLQPAFYRLGRKFQNLTKPITLGRSIFVPDVIYSENAIDEIFRGLITQNIETLDSAVTDQVKNHLMEQEKVPFSGLDLISLNLQRAREHGIPPYNRYRAMCNLTRAKTFDDLSNEIPASVIENMKKVYRHVDDIDLFTGGLSEKPLHGGSVGPTFGCVIGKQFLNQKRCDRFWHETSDPYVRFTPQQLTEIRKTSFANVICRNTDIKEVQRQIMDMPDAYLNPRTPCTQIPDVDLSAWQDLGSNCRIGTQTVKAGESVKSSPCSTCTCTKEGPLCRSIRVRNCFHLIFNNQKEDILKEPVCLVQCAFAFHIFPKQE